MARLMDLSEESNFKAQREFDDLRRTMAAMRGEEVSSTMGEDGDHFRRPLGSFHDDELNDARSVRSSQSHDQEPTSLLQPSAIERKMVVVK